MSVPGGRTEPGLVCRNFTGARVTWVTSARPSIPHASFQRIALAPMSRQRGGATKCPQYTTTRPPREQGRRSTAGRSRSCCRGTRNTSNVREEGPMADASDRTTNDGKHRHEKNDERAARKAEDALLDRREFLRSAGRTTFGVIGVGGFFMINDVTNGLLVDPVTPVRGATQMACTCGCACGGDENCKGTCPCTCACTCNGGCENCNCACYGATCTCSCTNCTCDCTCACHSPAWQAVFGGG